MTLTFYSEKTGKQLEIYNNMTSIKCYELLDIKRKIEKEYKDKVMFIIK
ncbi:MULTISPECIES: hypothetical protein [Clostridium]|nr:MULTISPECIES: hypothetical protein [Clostridium]